MILSIIRNIRYLSTNRLVYLITGLSRFKHFYVINWRCTSKKLSNRCESPRNLDCYTCLVTLIRRQLTLNGADIKKEPLQCGGNGRSALWSSLGQATHAINAFADTTTRLDVRTHLLNKTLEILQLQRHCFTITVSFYCVWQYKQNWALKSQFKEIILGLKSDPWFHYSSDLEISLGKSWRVSHNPNSKHDSALHSLDKNMG